MFGFLKNILGSKSDKDLKDLYPMVDKINSEFDKLKNVEFSKTIKESINNSDIVILHTDWNDFKSINFKKFSKNKKLIIYDMRNIFSPSKIKKLGLKYFGIGR